MAQELGKETGAEAPPDWAEFHCPSCGHVQILPMELTGRQARCPKCSAVGEVTPPRKTEHEPDVGDVVLDDLVQDAATPASKNVAKPAAGALALEAAPPPSGLAGHLRSFFSGSLPVNLLAGMVGGARLALVCLALALLVLAVPRGGALSGHALALTLIPAVLGSALFALNGRLPVALGAPDPSASLALVLFLAALSLDLAGRAMAQPEIQATLLAALAVGALFSGLAGVLLARADLPRRLRFLPDEVLGGIFAGFGLLLIKTWPAVLAACHPELAALAALPLAGLPQALMDCAGVWGPATLFALATFVVHLLTRGMVWPLLLIALAAGGWNLLPQLAPGLAERLPGLKAAVPQLLDAPASLALFDPNTLALVRWPELFSRLEFFLSVAVMAVLPSAVRVNILESVLDREADGGEQMRLTGAASLLSGALGALPSSLTLSGSLGLRALGASGPVAGFTAALVCLAALLGGRGVLPFVPMFLPLGLLLAIGLIMPVSWLLRDGRNPFSRPEDLRAGWAACLLVALLGPVAGVFLSLVLGLFLALSRAVAGDGLRLVEAPEALRSNVERSSEEARALAERQGAMVAMRLRGHLFLGTLYGVVRALKSRLAGHGAPLRYVLLDFTAVEGIGAGAVTGFRRLEGLARRHGLSLLFASVPLEVEQKLEGLGYRMGDDAAPVRIFVNLDYALEWCEERLLARAGLAEEQAGSLAEMLAANFPEPELVPALMRCLEREELPAKAVVLRQGEPSEAMYFLESGKVIVELSLPGGRIIRLKKLGPGTLFGEMGLFTKAPRSASVITCAPCVLHRLSARRFQLIQAKAPQLASAISRFVVDQLAQRVAEANAKARAAAQSQG